jgi:hypothetical protein
MSTIILKDFNLGGIANSKYQGPANSVHKLVGFDIHSEPGILKVNQKMTKESGSTVDDLVKAIVPCSDGNAYLFGSTNGKIWKRTSAGVYSLVATVSPAAGAVGIMDAAEYQGYIYYSMQSRLGRWQIGLAWSGREDNYATFTNTDADYHPIFEQKQTMVLYIGDKNYVAQVDAGTFSDKAVDVKSPLRISALGKYLTDLLMGSFINSNVSETWVIRWNTWSVSFSSADDVPEVGINCFLPTDNYVLVQAGRKGNFYIYTGVLEQYKKMPGDWSGTNEAIVYPNAAVNRNGLPLFGLSNLSGNPTEQGIYSFGSYSQEYSKILNLEYLISTGNSSNIVIGAIVSVGNDLLVSWKDTTTGTVYGIDKLDTANKFTGAYLDTRVIAVDRGEKKDFNIEVYYRTLPTGCSIQIWQSIDGGSYTQITDTTTDTLNKKITIDSSVAGVNTVQFRIKPIASANTAPEIEEIDITF